MLKSPRVSVLMAAYEAAATIGPAIDSALRQSLSDLEVLVVDDGSTDETVEIVSSYGDPRVRLVRNPKNLGIPATRQRGAEEARGEYLAILDSDDLAHATRIEEQAAYLDAHPECGVVGSWARIVSPDGRFKKLSLKPTAADALRARVLFRNLVKDATAMTRTALVRQYGFREEFPVCELTDLWQRMSRDHEVANIPAILTTYRDHDAGITKRSPELMRRAKSRLAAEQLAALGLQYGELDLSRHIALSKPGLITPDPTYLDWAEHWFLRLRAANRLSALYPGQAFELALGEYWWKLCRAAAGSELGRWRRFWRSPHRPAGLRYVASTAASTARVALEQRLRPTRR